MKKDNIDILFDIGDIVENCYTGFTGVVTDIRSVSEYQDKKVFSYNVSWFSPIRNGWYSEDDLFPISNV